MSLQQFLYLIKQIFRFSFSFAEPRISNSNYFSWQGLIGGENDDWNIKFQLLHFVGDRHAVHAGHPVVQNDQIDGMSLEQLEGLLPRFGSDYVVAFRLQKQFSEK